MEGKTEETRDRDYAFLNAIALTWDMASKALEAGRLEEVVRLGGLFNRISEARSIYGCRRDNKECRD